MWGVVRVPIAETSPKASSASDSGSGSVSSVVGLRKELGGGDDYDEEDGDSDLDKVIKEGIGFDEGKARLRLAMVFVMIGVACLTGAPLGGVLLDKGAGSWTGAQVFAGTSVAVGGCFLVGARWAKEGWGSGRM